MKSNWLQAGGIFMPQDGGNRMATLPVGIYKLQKDCKEQLYLVHVQEKFTFPYKIYGVEESFVNRVVKTYKATKGNLGILMNGVKGTGKTVTSELICNALNLPVILINDFYEQTPSFINDMQQDCIVVFDEYEKTYSDYEHSILSVMDGILSNEYRKTFILTTNTLHINDNLLQRPGRIRYMKTFDDLKVPVIEEIVDDTLIDTEKREGIIKFISELEIITIDIVKAIVSEVNIHREEPEEFKDVFNVKTSCDKFDIYELQKNGKQELIFPEAEVHPKKMMRHWIGRPVTVNGESAGNLVRILDDNTFILSHPYEKQENGQSVKITYKLVEVSRKHFSFQAYAF